MQQRDVDRFFKALALRIDHTVRIYLTGGVAARLMGGVRPTEDIDFAVKTDHWDEVAALLERVSRERKVVIQFSDQIGRWGMIGSPDPTIRRAKFYRRFGKVRVYVLDPIQWSIGKLSRYTSDDVADLEAVFRRQRVSPRRAALQWARALLDSPRSSAQSLFARQVEDFLRYSGPVIWGRGFKVDPTIRLFRKTARIR